MQTKIKLVRFYLLLLALAASLALQAQNREIQFMSGDFDEALQKARQSGKLLFLDCQTSWCGPCKLMAKEVFTVDSVADFFNTNFICLKKDMEVGEGPVLKEEFQVSAYPTFLLIDSRRNEIFRLVGQQSVPDFMRKIKEGMKPENSIAALTAKYKAGSRDAAFVYQYCAALKRGFQTERLKEVIDDYFAKMKTKTICRDENWKIYDAYVKGVDEPVFHRMIEKVKEFKALRGAEAIEKKLTEAYAEVVFNAISAAPLTDEQYQRYAGEIEQIGMRDDKQLFYLRSYLHLAHLRAQRKYDEFLDIVEAGLEGYEPERRQTLAMSLLFLADGTAEQRQRGEKILIREAREMMAANGGKLSPNISQVMGFIQHKLRGGEQAGQPAKADASGVPFPVCYQNETQRLNALYPLKWEHVDSAASAIRQIHLGLVRFIHTAGLPADSALLWEAQATMNAYSTLLGMENSVRWIVRKDTILPPAYYKFVQTLNLGLPVWRGVKGMNEFLTTLFAVKEKNGYLESGPTDYLRKRALEIGDSVVRENYLVYALQQELKGYHQHLPQVITSVQPYIISAEGKKTLEDIREKHRQMATQYAHLNAGGKVADLTGKDKNGKTYSLKDYIGKVVVIDVWSIHCLPCIAEMPYFQLLEKRFENKEVVFISYAVDRQAEPWKKFIEDKKWKGIQLVDVEGNKSAFSQHFAIHTTPRTILIGRDGKIADCWGAKPSDPLLGMEIEKLLAK